MVSLLLIGDLSAQSPPFVPRFDGPLEVTRARDLEDAARLLGNGTCAPPELVVLAESHGGQFGHASLAALRKQAPLARVWRMLGSWCEGESRSGRPPAGCLATYWHRWEAGFASDMESVRRGGNPGWALPLTATADERILVATDSSFEIGRRGLIAICATSATAAGSLADLCRAAGHDTLIVSEDARFHAAGASAVVWDTTVQRMADAALVAGLRSRSGGAPVVALVGFPRPEDVESAERARIAAVISKPFLAADLRWHLDRATCRS